MVEGEDEGRRRSVCGQMGFTVESERRRGGAF